MSYQFLREKQAENGHILTLCQVKGITFVPGVLNMYERRSKLLLAHRKIAIGLRPLMSRILGI